MGKADSGNVGQARLAARMVLQFFQRLQQLLAGQRLTVVPAQLAAQKELPA
ncbi:hypothetical protein D3C73_1641880 [compost metagenome]